MFLDGGLTVDLQPGLATHEVERRLVLAMRAGELCNRALAFYLAELQERRLYQALGFPDVVEFARKRLGMGRRRTYQLLATGRHLAELPRVDRAFARGELSWSKARCIARVATPDTEQAWVERARLASQEQVETIVSGCHKGDPPPRLGEGLPRSRFVVKVTLDAIGHEMLELAREKLQAELGRIVTDEELLREALALILSSDADGTVPGRKKVDGSRFRVVVQGPQGGREERQPGGRAQTAVPVSGPQLESLDSDARVGSRLRRRILERDGYRCQACASRRDLMVHHVLWRSRDGTTVPSNLCTACSRCHGLLHDELLFVSGVPGRWEFTDRRGRRVDKPISPPDVQLKVESTMVDNPTSGHGPATEHESTMVDNPISGRGPAARPGTEKEPLLTSLDDIPDEIDPAWWRKHEKLLEWTPAGLGLCLRKQRRST